MKLCITEKPSVGRDIAAILGASERHDGYFEGNGYCVTWTFGHLCTLKEPHDYDAAWKRWALGALPMIPNRFGIKLIDDPGIERQFKVIEHLITECDEIINCGDAGQEGELIQRWVMQKAGCKKPVKRLWISSLTDEAIREGFNHLRPEKDLEPLYTAGLCRAIGDWVLGLNATRLYTLKYGERGQVLSIGRVQTPTLALVVNRQLEIENFVPKDSWEIKTKYRDTIFTATTDAFAKEEDAVREAYATKDQPFVIENVTRKKSTEAPPRLFDLTSLQVECNKKFGMSADATLRIIQSLYEKKVATYPRVDTTYLTEDIYPKCGTILNSLVGMKDLLEPLRGRKLLKSKKVFDNTKVTDHHAIIPTGQNLPKDLSGPELDVFNTIARRFISVFYPDYVYQQTTVSGKTGTIKFKATGRLPISMGWKVVYATERYNDSSKDKDAEQQMPEFTPGESGPHQPFVSKKTTQPPKYFTEGTLLKAMETAGNLVEDEDLRESLKANGIGRPSTRAAIIEVLFRRGYIRRERKSLRATQAGIDLISLIHEELLKSAKLTGIWENRLRRIERGEYSPSEFITSIKKMVNEIVISVLSDNSNRRIIAENTEEKSKKEKKSSGGQKQKSNKKG